MSEGSSSPKRVRVRGRWVVAILAASLLLNIFFVAAQVGNVFRHGGGHHCARGDGMRSFIRENPDVRELARKHRRQLNASFDESRSAIEGAQGAYIAALRADPFDAERLAAAQGDHVAARSAMRDARDASVRSFILELSADQRARLATHLEKQAECKRDYWRRKRERADKD